MVVAGRIHIEVPVHQVVDVRLFGCELQHLQCLSLRYAGAARKPGGSTGLLRSLRFMSAPVFTLFVKRREGVCRISHAVDTSVSSELKAR